MRVAVFSEVYWPMVSGVSHTLQRLQAALGERGHEIRVYSATYPLPPGTADRPEVHRSPSRPLFLSPEVQWAFPRLPEVTRDLEGFGPDLVHLATEFTMGLAGLRAAQRLGVPIIASAHTDYERYAGRYGLDWAAFPGWTYLRWFYAQAKLVLCPSCSYEVHLHQRGVRHTGLWTRGVDTRQFDPALRSEEFRARFGLGVTDQLVLYVGRLAPEKGIERLLAAWATLGEQRGKRRLVFVGSGVMGETIRRRALPGVHLTGPLTGRELGVAYASGDIFVLPSSTETFGNVLLEGMASGLACLALRAGGVTEFARDWENALLVDPERPRELGDALALLLTDPVLRARLGQGARETALDRGWGPVFDRLLEDYARVAALTEDERAA